jgi:hypothetical protein
MRSVRRRKQVECGAAQVTERTANTLECEIPPEAKSIRRISSKVKYPASRKEGIGEYLTVRCTAARRNRRILGNAKYAAAAAEKNSANVKCTAGKEIGECLHISSASLLK